MPETSAKLVLFFALVRLSGVALLGAAALACWFCEIDVVALLLLAMLFLLVATGLCCACCITGVAARLDTRRAVCPPRLDVTMVVVVVVGPYEIVVRG